MFGDESGWKEGQCPSIKYRKYSAFDLSRKLHIEDRGIAYQILQESEDGIIECGGFKTQNGALLSYTGEDEEVHLPEGISCIEENAFADAKQITELYLPASLIYVADNVFEPLLALDDLYVLSENVNVFAGIRAYESMQLIIVHVKKESVSDLAYADECDSRCGNAFQDNIILAPFSYRIENGTILEYDGSLKEFTVPDGVLAIGDNCFAGDQYLKKINLPEGLLHIGENAFQLLEIEEITLPEGLLSIGKSAFYSTWVSNIKLPNSIIEIGDMAFAWGEEICEINLPEGLKKIGKEAFRRTGIEEITIPESIEFIDDYAFFDCYALKVVNCNAKEFDFGEYIFGDDDMPKINAPRRSAIYDATSGLDSGTFYSDN